MAKNKNLICISDDCNLDVVDIVVLELKCIFLEYGSSNVRLLWALGKIWTGPLDPWTFGLLFGPFFGLNFGLFFKGWVCSKL